ncbi:GAF domain-containing protein [Nonomuraea ferruginea]
MRTAKLILLGSRGTTPESVERFNQWSATGKAGAEAPANATEPVFFASRRELREVYPPVVDDPLSACAALPLTTPRRTLGTLVIGYDRPHHFTESERATLTSLSGLVAQALDRAQLYDVKHDLAQSLQESLLPPPPATDRRAGGGRPLPARHPRHGHRRRLLRPDQLGRRVRGGGHRRRAGTRPGGGGADGAGAHGDPRLRGLWGGSW